MNKLIMKYLKSCFLNLVAILPIVQLETIYSLTNILIFFDICHLLFVKRICKVLSFPFKIF